MPECSSKSTLGTSTWISSGCGIFLLEYFFVTATWSPSGSMCDTTLLKSPKTFWFLKILSRKFENLRVHKRLLIKVQTSSKQSDQIWLHIFLMRQGWILSLQSYLVSLKKPNFRALWDFPKIRENFKYLFMLLRLTLILIYLLTYRCHSILFWLVSLSKGMIF